MVLGDFEVKIKDIINEGFGSGFIRGLTPSALRSALDTIAANKPDLSSDEVGAAAYKKFGASPDYDKKKEAELLAKTTDPTRQQKIKDILGKQSWGALRRQQKAAATSTPAQSRSISAPLHPDVSVTSSYPLRLRYKNGDFVLDPATNQWMTVSGKKIAPTMSSFLQAQANKL